MALEQNLITVQLNSEPLHTSLLGVTARSGAVVADGTDDSLLQPNQRVLVASWRR